jgi:hypothetical protein
MGAAASIVSTYVEWVCRQHGYCIKLLLLLLLLLQQKLLIIHRRRRCSAFADDHFGKSSSSLLSRWSRTPPAATAGHSWGLVVATIAERGTRSVCGLYTASYFHQILCPVQYRAGAFRFVSTLRERE